MELTRGTETDTCALQVQYRLEPNLGAGRWTGVRRAVNGLTLGSLILFVAIYLYDGLKSQWPISPSLIRGGISPHSKGDFFKGKTHRLCASHAGVSHLRALNQGVAERPPVSVNYTDILKLGHGSFSPIVQDSKENFWGFYLEGKTDSESRYWKHAVGSAFLKPFPSRPQPAHLSCSTLSGGSRGAGQRYCGEKRQASHIWFGAQNALEKSQAEKG